MDVNKILSELKQEKLLIEESILALERVGLGRGKRRGRPPKWMTNARQTDSTPKKRGRPPKAN